MKYAMTWLALVLTCVLFLTERQSNSLPNPEHPDALCLEEPAQCPESPHSLTIPSAKIKAQSPISVTPYALEAYNHANLIPNISLFAPTITVTKTDALVTDSGSPGATPGDVIEYTVVISNTGGMDATGVTFSDMIDANTTLVPGSVSASPIALGDTYSSIGNVGITVPAGNGVLANDIDPDNNVSLSVIAAAGATAQGGAFSIATDGGFSYTPPVGYEGGDSFTYTLTDGDPNTPNDVATVTITVANSIWFINSSSVAGTEDGRLNTPFKSIANFQAVNDGMGAHPAAGDVIFLHTGSGNYTGPITLLNNQKLVGQGASASLATITGFTIPPYSNPLPTTGGTNPTITTTVAATNAITLGMNNLIRGLTVGNTTGYKIIGNDFGTVTIGDVTTPDVNLNGTGPALSLTTGILAGKLNELTSTSGGGNVLLSAVSGTLNPTSGAINSDAAGAAFSVTGSNPTITYPGTITKNSGTGKVVNIDGTTGNSITFNGTVTGSNTSTGVTINNANGNVTFTTLTLGSSIARFSTTALTISGGTGTYNLGVLTAFSNGTTTFSATNADGTINCSNTSTLNSTNGPAIDIDGPAGLTTLGLTFASINCATSTTRGISIQDTNGSFTCNGGTISNISQRGASFVNATNISLKDMPFTNANTSDAGGAGVCDYATTGSCNAAIYLSSVNTVTLDNVDITGTTVEQGINGVSVTAFVLKNSTVANCGDAVEEGCVKLRNLTGTCEIKDNAISKAADRMVDIYNNNTNLTLTISGNTFDDTQFSAVGSNALEIVGAGNSQLVLDVLNNTFTKNKTFAAEITGRNTATIDFDFTNNTVNPMGGIGNGVQLALENTAVGKFNISGNPMIEVKGGTGVTISAKQTSVAEGRIKNNTIKQGGTGQFGYGVGISLEFSPTVKVEVDGNTITNGGFDAGVYSASSGVGTANLNLTVSNNSITGVDASYQGAVYTQVGDGIGGDTHSACVNVKNNVVTVPMNTSYWTVVVFGGSTVNLPGTGANAQTVWNGNGNTPMGALGTTIQEVIIGTRNVVASPCTLPSNPLPVVDNPVVMLTNPQDNTPESVNASPLSEPQTDTTLIAANQAPTDLPTPPSAKKDKNNLQKNLLSGETVTVNGTGAGFTLPAGESTTIKFRVTINSPLPTGICQISNQGVVTATGGINVMTDDPDVGGATDATVTPLAGMTLGDLVFKDNNKNGVFDGGDAGINSVTVNLYRDNGTTAGILDASDAFVSSTTTAGGGLYSFTNLCSGDYIVQIPSSEFGVGQALNGLISSPTGAAPDPDNNTDNDDNGQDAINSSIASQAITLSYSAGNVEVNNTLDFGFKTPTTVTIDDPMVMEGNVAGDNSVLTFTVTRSDNADAFSLDIAITGGSASGGGVDYFDPAQTTVSFTAGGSLTATFTVDINEETLVEPDETVQVTISNPPSSVVITDNVGLGTIKNDDSAVISIAATTQAAEDATNGLFTISTDKQFDSPVTVNFTVTGTATSGTDYTSIGTSIMFPANTNSVTIPVSVLPDAIVETNETVIVTLTSISPANPSISIDAMPNNSATVTITDNDGPATVSIDDVMMMEGDAPNTTNFVFTVSLDKIVDANVTLDFMTMDGTATIANSDYQSNTGMITFLANGTLPQTQTITVVVNGDNTGEPNEQFAVVLKNLMANGRNVTFESGMATETGTGTILDDDLSFSISDAMIMEGNAGTQLLTFTVTRSSTATAETINYSTADNTAQDENGDGDYQSKSGMLSFGIGDNSEDITITINGDTKIEADETFFVNLSGQSNGSIADGQGVGTIKNDDFATLTLSGGTSKNEGNAGTTIYTFTVTLDKAVAGGLTVPFTVNDGTATDADDFDVITASPLNFTGTAGEHYDITVEVSGDTKVEADEMFSVSLGTVTGTLASAVNTSGSPQMATILNDDAATVSIAANVSQAENVSPQTFTITLSNPVDVPVTVLFNTSDGTATTADNDYTGVVNQMVTFPAGTTTAQTVDVTITNDNKVETNEVYNVAISSLSASGRNVTLGTSARTGTIVNDDAATVTLAPVNASQNEGNSGTTNFTFSVTLNNPVQDGFSVAYTTNDGTATTADNDYQDNDNTLMFTGTMGESQIITVQVNGDHKVEADETFSVALGTISGAPSGVIATGSPQMGTILNDEIDFGDAPDPTYPTLLASNGARHNTLLGFSLGAAIDGEDDGQQSANATGDGADEDGVTLPGALITGLNANITVSLTNTASIANPKLDAWVDFNGNGNFSDPGEQIFTNQALVAGNNNLSFAVPMGATVGTSFARFRLSSAGGLSYNGLAADGEVEDYQVQILNNQYSINSPSVAEGNAGTTDLKFTVSRTANNLAGSVDYAITGGTASTGDNDYQPLASGTINFTAGGSTSEDIIVKVIGDLKVEPDETIIITLSNPMGGGIGTGMGTGTITNDDAAVVHLQLLSANKNEGNSGTTDFTFTATLDNPVQGGFDLAYTTDDGSATVADNDYQDNDGTLNFAGTAGEQKIITVKVNGDTKVEANETFTVSIENTGFSNTTAPMGTLTTASTVMATIVNDDAATLSIDDVSKLEGISGTQIYTFTVTLSADVQGGVMVNYATANNTATAGSDYIATSNTLNFTGTAGETKTIDVTVNGDCTEEPDETFFVNLSNIVANVASGAITFADNQGLGTIQNDDASYPGGIIYVDASAGGANNGTSWTNAFTNLQDALRVACTCGVGQIWVADGTYYPDQGVAQTNDDRTSTFQLCNGVALYGGFAGGETMLSQRNVLMNVAMLSGDLMQNDGANFAGNGDNAYHVVNGSGTDMTARMDGFTITAGNANGSNANDTDKGAGMFIKTGSPCISNCIFSSNITSDATLTGGFGGGMWIQNSTSTISNCSFIGNQANYGGGIYITNALTISLVNCVISGNRANDQGGGIHNSGGGSPTLINGTVAGNYAKNGGGIFNFGGPVIITNTLIWNNQDFNDISTVSIFGGPNIITYSLIQGQNPPGAGNKDGITNAANANYPLFVAPVSPAAAPTTAGDYRLQITSPVINMGNDAAVPADSKDVDDDGNTAEATPDRDLNNRLVGGIAPNKVDLGAYEFPCAADAGLIANSEESDELIICQGSDPGFTFSAQGQIMDASYLYAFLLVDGGGNIVQFNTNGDFDLTTLAVGTYTVYGLSYANFNTPDNIAAYLMGKTIADVQTDDAGTTLCLALSNTPVEGQTTTITVNEPATVKLNETYPAICVTKTVDLTQLGAMIGGSATSATWSVLEADSDGTFSPNNVFGTATTFKPGKKDGQRGYVTLVLTTNDPEGPCPAASAQIRIVVQNVDCGSFPWNGN